MACRGINHPNKLAPYEYATSIPREGLEGARNLDVLGFGSMRRRTMGFDFVNR